MSIGPKILGQSTESLRKIRNSARFILGNIGDEESRKCVEKVGKAEMGMVRLFNDSEGERNALMDVSCCRPIGTSCMSCTNWRRPRWMAIRRIIFRKVILSSSFRGSPGPIELPVINALANFTNITLSSLYFDITKDCLYADAIDSVKRRAVVTVLEQVNCF